MFTRSKVRSAHHLTSHIPVPSGLQTPFHTNTPFNYLSFFVMGLAMYFLFILWRGPMTLSCLDQAQGFQIDDLLKSPTS